MLNAIQSTSNVGDITDQNVGDITENGLTRPTMAQTSIQYTGKC